MYSTLTYAHVQDLHDLLKGQQPQLADRVTLVRSAEKYSLLFQCFRLTRGTYSVVRLFA